MGHASRKNARLSSSEGDSTLAYAPGQHAAQHGTFFMLTDVNVQRWPVAVRRQASFNFQDDLTPITNAAKTQRFTGVPILELKMRVHYSGLLAQRHPSRLRGRCWCRSQASCRACRTSRNVCGGALTRWCRTGARAWRCADHSQSLHVL